MTQEEGVVMVWPDAYKLKCKSSNYILKHRTKDSLSQEKNVLELVIDDKVDDLAGILDEDDFDRVKAYAGSVWTAIARHAFYLTDQRESVRGWERKDVALQMKELMSKPFLSAFWQVYEGKDPEKAIVEVVKKNLTNSTKVDSVRCLFGADWSEY